MPARRPVIAGNWKMYKTANETALFLQQLKPLVKQADHCEIVVAPPFTSLTEAAKEVQGTNISIAGQDVFWEAEGAYTGEVSAPMLVQAGCRYVIIGHSERRQYFGEANDTVRRKVMAALNAGLRPIVCLGEVLAEREAGQTESVIQKQFQEGFADLATQLFLAVIIAYEPVWAIGTGRTATPPMASAVHRFIRQLAGQQFGPDAANGLRVLYGGSVKPENIKGLMAEGDIDGALVGGASLKADSFASIVHFR